MKKYLILALLLLSFNITVKAQEASEITKPKKRYLEKIGIELPMSMHYVHNHIDNSKFAIGMGATLSFSNRISEDWIVVANLGYDYYPADSIGQNLPGNKEMRRIQITGGAYKILFPNKISDVAGKRLIYLGFELGYSLNNKKDANEKVVLVQALTPVCYFVGGLSGRISKYIGLDLKLKSFLMFDNRVSAGISLYLPT